MNKIIGNKHECNHLHTKDLNPSSLLVILKYGNENDFTKKQIIEITIIQLKEVMNSLVRLLKDNNFPKQTEQDYKNGLMKRIINLKTFCLKLKFFEVEIAELEKEAQNLFFCQN